MASGTDAHTTKIGALGELYAEVQMVKNGIYAQKMPVLFDYDFMTTSHKRVEVKASKIQYGKKIHKGKEYRFQRWQFRNYDTAKVPVAQQKGRDRSCDFYVFICLDDAENYYTGFVVPNSEIRGKLMIYITEATKNKLQKYRESWALLK